MIQKFVNAIIKYRWFIAILMPMITVILGMQLRHTQFDGSYRIWFAEDSKTLQEYDHFKNVFGNDASLIITFDDQNGIMNK